MARQIQLRRGTKAQNELFIGAEGELTMDTDTKSLRIHDSSTAGGILIPTLVDFQRPTSSNNYTWYRLYSDGWVEQGGLWRNWNPVNASKGRTVIVTLPITMSDKNYTANLSLNSIGPSYAGLSYAVTQYTTSTIALNVWNFQISGNYTDAGVMTWVVSGYAA